MVDGQCFEAVLPSIDECCIHWTKYECLVDAVKYSHAATAYPAILLSFDLTGIVGLNDFLCAPPRVRSLAALTVGSRVDLETGAPPLPSSPRGKLLPAPVLLCSFDGSLASFEAMARLSAYRGCGKQCDKSLLQIYRFSNKEQD